MAWRLAKSLARLRDEVNALAGSRSKASDGTIGDAAHRSRPSRHNPNDHGVVCALDLTHDPGGGCDIHAIANQIRLRTKAGIGHPELDYVISNGRVASRRTGWDWHRYTGSNPHTRHAHFAVGVGPDGEPRPPYDSDQPWEVAAIAPPTTPPSAPAPTPARPKTGPVELRWDLPLSPERRHADPAAARIVQQVVGARPDGDYFNKTAAAVKGYQRALGLADDGITGPVTAWAAIQNILRDQGHYHGRLDGDPGPMTQAAVYAFQRSRGLTDDGKIGPKTTMALGRAAGAPGF